MDSELSTLVERFITARTADGRAPRTLQDYARVLWPFVDGHLTVDLTRETIRAYVAKLQASSWKPATVAIHIRNLRAFLRWLNTEGYTADNLALAVKAPRTTTRIEIPIMPEEIQALLDTCTTASYHDRRDRALIMILCDTGLRVGELVGLIVGHWRRESDSGGSYLLVLAPKTHSYRYAILGRAATSALVNYLELRGTLPGDAPLFATAPGKSQGLTNGQPMKVRAVGSLLVRRGALAGLERCRTHPHIFRKSFATTFLDNGGDTERLRVLAGWSSMEMVKIYADSSLRRLQEVHRRAGPVDQMKLRL
jgi:integrase/recombinase XerD